MPWIGTWTHHIDYLRYGCKNAFQTSFLIHSEHVLKMCHLWYQRALGGANCHVVIAHKSSRYQMERNLPVQFYIAWPPHWKAMQATKPKVTYCHEPPCGCDNQFNYYAGKLKLPKYIFCNALCTFEHASISWAGINFTSCNIAGFFKQVVWVQICARGGHGTWLPVFRHLAVY